MIAAFIFDMDGVIIDSEPIHFEIDIQTMHHLGAQISKEQLEKYVGMTNPEMWSLIKQEFNLSQSVTEIIEYQLSNKIDKIRSMYIEPIEGIVELLEELKSRKIRIGLASSSPRKFIDEVISKFNITEYFDSIISGEEVEKGKPAPDIYIATATLLGADPKCCYVLEDSRNGIIAAKTAGMYCIGYVNLNSGDQDLSEADIIVSSINGLGMLLN